MLVWIHMVRRPSDQRTHRMSTMLSRMKENPPLEALENVISCVMREIYWGRV
jgi:hypothetical protein